MLFFTYILSLIKERQTEYGLTCIKKNRDSSCKLNTYLEFSINYLDEKIIMNSIELEW